MSKPQSTKRHFAWRSLTAALMGAGALLTATADAGQNTTMGTRGSLATERTPVTTNAGATWKDYTRAADYPNAITLPLQFITTSKGKKLAVLVSVPADSANKPVVGKFPVILTQTAYRIDTGQLLGQFVMTGNTLILGGKDEFMIRRGYISVAVDVVGSGLSDGSANLIGKEEQEGYAEAVNWVTQQDWFDGNLGLAGTSYLGITTLHTAAQQHAAVKAAFAEVPMGDSYRGTVMPGGMQNGLFISNWLPMTQMLSINSAATIKKYPEFTDQLTAANEEHIAAVKDWYLPTVTKSINNEVGYSTDDGDLWATQSPIEKANRIKVPTFLVGASNDIFQRDEPLLYEQIKPNALTKLVILPGAHVQSVLAAQSSNKSAGGAPGTSALMLQWFDQYLKGMATGVESLPNVTQYVQGYGKSGDRFAIATDWPHPQATAKRMYLRGDLTISAMAPTADEAPRTITEPTAPVITFSASSDGKTAKGNIKINDGSDCSSSYVQWSLGIGGLISKGCFNNSVYVEKGQKAIVYQTERLASDMYINGPIEADVWMSATKGEAAVSVRVDMLDPFGRAFPISTGLQSAAYRAVDKTRSRYMNGEMIQPWHPFTAASRQDIVPGQPMLVPVEVFPAAALVRKGYRLRVAISASNQAMGIFPAPLQAIANGNVSTILSGPNTPTSIVLPMVPTSVLAP
jgi:putative CocE/NonD family hydrolase